MFHVLALLYTRIERIINNYLKSYGLSSAQFNILMVLKSYGGANSVNQVEISKKMLVSQCNITRLIDKLYKDKLVTKKEDKKDRRNKLIKLTAKGESLCSLLWPKYRALILALSKNVPMAAKGNISQGLMKWLYCLEKGDENN